MGGGSEGGQRPPPSQVSLTLSPTSCTSRNASSTLITTQDGSNSNFRMLNLGLEGYAWWLLWRLSPPVSQASSRMLVALFVRKFFRRSEEHTSELQSLRH